MQKDFFFKEVFKRLPYKLLKNFENKKVGIAGVGGLGSNIAVSLVRSGITNLLIVDFDKVEYSNLNRQHYFLEHVGMYKVDALEKQLLSINPFLNIEKYRIKLSLENFNVFEDCDIIAEAFDVPEMKESLVDYAVKNGKFIVSASGMGGNHSANSIKTLKIGKKLFISGDFKSGAEQGLTSPRVLVVANHQANIILRILEGNYDL